MRESSVSIGAIKNVGLILVVLIAVVGSLHSQELTPTSSPTQLFSPAPTSSLPPLLQPSPTSSATVPSTPVSARSVRISFVPPPLDGTISLGIYDTGGKLVRVLHQQASLDVFTIGADGLVTKWDGKNDSGQDLPPGKYHARGYTVGALRIENLGSDAASPPPADNQRVVIKLMANPLVKNDRPNVELLSGFDNTRSFIKTSDDLPLYVISQRTDITGLAMSKADDKSVDVWQTNGAGTEHLRLSKLDQMMAFDCGVFDLK